MRLLPIAKCIVKDLSNSAFDDLRGVDRDRMSEHERKKPDVIKTVQVICMFMGVQDGVHQADLFPQKLHPQFRRGIDEQVPLG